MINFDNNLDNYWGGNMVSSSTDLIAVKYGLKKATRIQCRDLAEAKKLSAEFTGHGLFTACSREKLFDHYNLYISRQKKYANLARDIDPSYQIIIQKKSFNEIEKTIAKFGWLLSYPDCCVRKYQDNTSKKIGLDKATAFNRIPRRINFVFNNFLNGVANYYLSFHLPCSFTCKKTLAQNDKIFNAVKKESPEFARRIHRYLARPYLLFLDPSSPNIHVAWDKRWGLFFEGQTDGHRLNYSGCSIFQTHYPDYAADKSANENIQLLSAKIKTGDRLFFDSSSFKIFRGRKLIYEFKNRPDLHFYFFNFVT
ncbi:MAG: hypothetical protein UU87_C0003G0016 [Parcubacteria group bacterium GW2011_GWA2_42_11]|nr:MAG: hypothetical protein UU87_C0003G0016 [Parcubacteria group bacterium GW2011_GWA2_42_11]